MNLEDKIIYAERLINNLNVGLFDRLYPFSTENLTYMNNFDFKDKSFLTVGSSCDQIFNAHLLGAKKIVCFDINPLTDVYYALKCCALKVLDYKDFLLFFSYHFSFFKRNSKVFDRDIFNYIFSSIKDDNLYFWKYFFDKYPSSLIRKRLFMKDEYYTKIVTRSNSYLSLDGYNNLVCKIDTLSPFFINQDFRNISEFIDTKFDYINLSNIAAFIERMYDDPLFDFKKDVLKLCDFLKDDGILFLAYLYEMNLSTKFVNGWDIIYDLNNVLSCFGSNHIRYIECDNIYSLDKNNCNFNDLILIYKK